MELTYDHLDYQKNGSENWISALGLPDDFKSSLNEFVCSIHFRGQGFVHN